VRPEQLHLTLKFIGEIDETDLPAAVECLTEAVSVTEPFRMEVSGLSGFPPSGTPRIVHAPVHERTGALQKLHEAVESGLADELGIAPEKRRYVPHITLGRVKRRGECPTVGQMQQALARDGFGTVDVDSMVLMESELRPDGAVYSVIHRFPLG
jgi:2'-5' RNA ligase